MIIDLGPGKTSLRFRSRCDKLRHLMPSEGHVAERRESPPIAGTQYSPVSVMAATTPSTSEPICARFPAARPASDFLIFSGTLGTRKWLVVRFRNPFAQTVLDRVEVSPATHRTGMKPQLRLLFQLSNLFGAQATDALFYFHSYAGNDCKTPVGILAVSPMGITLRPACLTPFGCCDIGLIG
jgi:hypothetical protein